MSTEELKPMQGKKVVLDTGEAVNTKPSLYVTPGIGIKERTAPYNPWDSILDYDKVIAQEEQDFAKREKRERDNSTYKVLGETFRTIGEAIGVSKGAHQEKRDITFQDDFMRSMKSLDAEKSSRLNALRGEMRRQKQFNDQLARQKDKDKQNGEQRDNELKARGKEADKERKARAEEQAKDRAAQIKIAGIRATTPRKESASTTTGQGEPVKFDYLDGKGNKFGNVELGDVQVMASNYMEKMRKAASELSFEGSQARKELESLQKSPEWKALESLSSGRIDGTEKEMLGAVRLVWDEAVYNNNNNARAGIKPPEKKPQTYQNPWGIPPAAEWEANKPSKKAAVMKVAPQAATPKAPEASYEEIMAGTDSPQAKEEAIYTRMSSDAAIIAAVSKKAKPGKETEMVTRGLAKRLASGELVIVNGKIVKAKK